MHDNQIEYNGKWFNKCASPSLLSTLTIILPVPMPRSSLTASLLQSGYKVVNQSPDHPALPENYRSPVSQLHSNDSALNSNSWAPQPLPLSIHLMFYYLYRWHLRDVWVPWQRGWAKRWSILKIGIAKRAKRSLRVIVGPPCVCISVVISWSWNPRTMVQSKQCSCLFLSLILIKMQASSFTIQGMDINIPSG